jgi:hypothetical protein
MGAQRDDKGRFLKGNTEQMKAAGKPKPRIKELLVDFLDDIDPKDKPGKGRQKRKRIRRIIETAYDHAIAGDGRARDTILDRAYGKPVQEIEVRTDVAIDAPIIIEFGAVEIIRQQVDKTDSEFPDGSEE